MTRAINFEKTIRSRGAIKIGEFTTRAGLAANCKVELDNEFLLADPILANQIAENLAEKMAVYEPRLIVPVPEGANHLGELVAKKLGACYLALRKSDSQNFAFRLASDRSQAERTSKVGLVDDVFTSGSALRELSSMPEFADKVVAAGVIWDRSDSGLPKQLDFNLVSVVERYVPLKVEAPS
jgi:adenine/guanine phosphoribosyltransferase-like PRPP-binding protein